MTDILVTEAGFGADLGAFKFLDLKCRAAGIWPDCVVIVSTVRSLKYNAGIPKEELTKPNVDAVREGFPNLAKHIENMTASGIPVVVASNRFLTDTDEEIAEMKRLCEAMGARYAAAEVFAKGGEGGIELAEAVTSILDKNEKTTPVYTYDLTDPVEEKIRKVAVNIFGAKDIEILPEAKARIEEFTKSGYGELPICIAKTQYSLSDDPKALGRPEGFTLTVREVRLSAGAGYLVVLTGKILTMPGLPSHPAALDISIDGDGKIHGLF
jgi:formate--tetrahydrofolate ligase